MPSDREIELKIRNHRRRFLAGLVCIAFALVLLALLVWYVSTLQISRQRTFAIAPVASRTGDISFALRLSSESRRLCVVGKQAGVLDNWQIRDLQSLLGPAAPTKYPGKGDIVWAFELIPETIDRCEDHVHINGRAGEKDTFYFGHVVLKK